jgi:hypothetical protein
MKFDQTKTFELPPASESKTHRLANQLSIWGAQHPVLAILVVSLLAVLINCYPILFCGKSYVSPACAPSIVYRSWPTLPGISASRPTFQHGTDTGAMMWWGVPVGFIESRSVLDYGELPLWNRYSHAGDTLIGQAVSMLGDPLQWIVIFGHGSAGAWDVKFLMAKFIFCCGFGLLILRLLASRPLSLIYTALAAYCGAFFSINNHPAFFVFAYAPWILLSALAWLDVRSTKSFRWGVVWLLVNCACFNAGHVEPAVVLIGGLNLAAVGGVLIADWNFAVTAKVLGRLAVGALFFLGLTAPVWMSFLVALPGSYSMHSKIQILQLPVACLPGAFDDLFYQLKLPGNFGVSVPGTSLLVLAGCCFAFMKRQPDVEPFFWVNSAAILLWGGCVFGGIPAAVLATIPLLNRVGHTYTDFSYLLVIHLTIQSAYGFKWLARNAGSRRVIIGFGLLAVIFMALNGLMPHPVQPVERNYFWCVEIGAIGAPLLFVFLKNYYPRIPAVGLAGVAILGFIPNHRFGLYDFGNDYLLMLPGQRAVLNAPSQVIDRIKMDPSGPFRVVGSDWNMAGDYSAVYGLEGIGSCAPLSNGELINLIQKFPGMGFGAGWVITLPDPVAAQPLLNLLNVKYVLAAPNLPVPAGQNFRLAGRSDFAVLENRQVWPRAFFSDQIFVRATTDDFVQQLLTNGMQPFIALTGDEMEKQPGIQSLTATKQATVSAATNYRLTPNATEFDVHATSAGVVCLSEGHAKDFTAQANNEPKAVLTVNRVGKGIFLDQPGDYHVKFIYRPRHWRLASACFWAAIGGVLMLALWRIFHFNGATKTAGNSITDH